MNAKDKLTEALIRIISEASEPLETKEIEAKLPMETRTKIINRLRDLAVKGEIKGKTVGSGRKAWIWWRKNAFNIGN
jgi:predicted Zn-ribbon and HTH transcriptional regulator